MSDPVASAARQRRTSLLGKILIALLFVGAAGGWWWYQNREPPLPAWQAERYLPQDADVALWTAPLGELADHLGELGQQVPGLSGVFDLLKLNVGADLRDREATLRAGLRRDAGLAVSIWRNGLWLAVPVAGPKGADHALEMLRRRGYGVGAAEPHGQGRSWPIADRQGGQGRARAWLLPDSVVVRVALDPTPTGNDLGAVDALVAAPPRQDLKLDGAALRIVSHWGTGTPQAGLIQGQLHKLLGPADLLIGALADKVAGIDGRATLGKAGVGVKIALQTDAGALKEIAAFHQGFVATGGELAVADLLPDETPLLLRVRANPALWTGLPEMIRDQALPQTALGRLHDSLTGVDARQLVAALDGQLAFSLLAIGDQVPLDPNQWPHLWWRTSLRLAVGASFKTDQLAAEWMGKLRSAIDTSADKTQPAEFGAWRGFAVQGPGAPWMVLQKAKHLAMVSGQGAVDDLRRVTEGKYQPLGKIAREGIDRDLIDGKNAWLGARVATSRLVRSLRRRGVPDYALQLIGAIDAVDARVQLQPDAAIVELDLRAAGVQAGKDTAVSGAGESQ